MRWMPTAWPRFWTANCRLRADGRLRSVTMSSRHDQLTRRHALLLTVALLACSPWSASAGDSDPARVLAPTGKLRAGLYPGTPTSILNNDEKPPRGVGYDIGQEL